MPLSLPDFVQRWKLNSQSERASAQSHFIDLCDLLGELRPSQDSAGERYAFEKTIPKTRGGRGFADVWLRDHFAWEYKGKHRDLKKAYNQLNDYREELGNPPLLVLCDLDRFEVHTNYTSTTKRVYAFSLDDLLRNQATAACPLPPLTVLRALFGDTDTLRPERTDAQVTQDAAKQFARLAERLEIEERSLGASRPQIAHFLMRLLFCLFADSIGLLPDKLFRKLLQSEDRFQPRRFLRKLTLLFEAMSQPDGIFGEHTIRWFNGGLFDSASIIELDKQDLAILYNVSKDHDWSRVAHAIFGTLFERSLDPARRSLIGAHYTSEQDILLLIEPVLMRPLQRRWAEVKQQVTEARDRERAEEAARPTRQARLRVDLESERLLAAWVDELTAVRVLDPACGSGNFLYVALRRLLDLWLEAQHFAAEQGIALALPKMVSPLQLYGIETEFYAHELASIVVWISSLQWKHEHGVREHREPILEKLSNIEHADAILRYDSEGKPYEPAWPQADYIIGNPPFLGGNRIRAELGDDYVNNLFLLYKDRVEPFADFVCYWFEKARHDVSKHISLRVGLLATQGIRGGVNREVLKRITSTGNIFFAYSDRKWMLEGAAVRISIIAFDAGDETSYSLDGEAVTTIHSNLTAGVNTTTAMQMAENDGICFMGPSAKAPFDVSAQVAQRMINAPLNVNGKNNRDVVRPVISGIDLNGRNRGCWTIDFGVNMSEQEAAKYEMPFEYINFHVRPLRQVRSSSDHKKPWWIYARPRPAMRRALNSLTRYIATPATAKHRVFSWVKPAVLCNQGTLVFARQDDYFFGVLHSHAHEVWARAQGTQLREVESGFRYTPDSTFDTFPFPWPPGTEPTEADSPHVHAIAEAARALVRLRDAWLNPPGAPESELKTRTLTNLYNNRPAWLANAHRILDGAVLAAYGWSDLVTLSQSGQDPPKQELLTRLLALNHTRAAPSAAAPKKKKKESAAKYPL